MAEIKCNLREPNALKETPINLVVRYNNQKLVYSSGRRIHPKYWDSTTQKAKRLKEFSGADLLNDSLRKMIDVIYSQIEGYRRDHNQQFPEIPELKSLLDVAFSRKADQPRLTFFSYIDWFTYEYAPKKQIVSGSETNLTSENTLKTYRTTLRLLELFAQQGGTFDFKDIDMKWYFRFTEWCNSNRNYNPSTIGKHIKVIKCWLRKAEEDGLHSSGFYKHRDFRKPAYLSETVLYISDKVTPSFRGKVAAKSFAGCGN
jgi:hypothetical protein